MSTPDPFKLPCQNAFQSQKIRLKPADRQEAESEFRQHHTPIASLGYPSLACWFIFFIACHPAGWVLLEDCRFFDHDGFDRDISHWNASRVCLGAGFCGLDLVDHFFAFNYNAEHRVAKAILGAGTIEKEVVIGVNEKLARCAIWIRRTSHGDRVLFIAEAISAFVDHRWLGRLFLEIRIHSTALNHESFDHSVENGPRIMTTFDVLNEVCDRLGRLLIIELKDNFALRGIKLNLRRFRMRAEVSRRKNEYCGKKESGGVIFGGSHFNRWFLESALGWIGGHRSVRPAFWLLTAG